MFLHNIFILLSHIMQQIKRGRGISVVYLHLWLSFLYVTPIHDLQNLTNNAINISKAHGDMSLLIKEAVRFRASHIFKIEKKQR